ncbi:hypothetical protein [Actinomadura macra]|uniref:hypothetical protein n=1 Tax=Actinomadura macra TaxID=46164 RepID=UPI00082D01E4|nr:hypothetical protein [Actinomadura macra]
MTAHEPVPLTEAEVAILAGDRGEAEPAVQRIRAARPSGEIGHLVSEKGGPATVSADEMEAMRQAGAPAEPVRERFTASAAGEERASAPVDRKDRPGRSPESG